MDLKLENKKALVTSSTAGIGYAIAKQLAKENKPIIFTDIRTNMRIFYFE